MKNSTKVSKLYGFPVWVAGLIYLCVQMIGGFVCMGFGMLFPMWLVVLVQLLILGIGAVGILITDITRVEIKRQDNSQQSNVRVMRALQAKAYGLQNCAKGTAAEKEISHLCEEIRYSDPVSNDPTTQIEKDLEAELDIIAKAFADGDTAKALSACTEAVAILAERNRLCKLSKNI